MFIVVPIFAWSFGEDFKECKYVPESLPFSDSTSWLKICVANAISGFSMPLCCDIDSEDEAWEGTIDLAIFQQVRDQQDKLRIIAKLEAQNRSNRSTPSVAARSPGRPSEGYGTATVNTSADSSKEGGSSGYRENGENKKLQARDCKTGKSMSGCRPKLHGMEVMMTSMIIMMVC